MFLRNSGFCCICEAETSFTAHGPWLRDDYRCDGCGTIPRARAVIEVLNHVRPDWRSVLVHESSPGTNHVALKCAGYSFSFFFEGIPLGGRSGEYRCESLEALTFEDGTFDVFITQDVLEHVFHPDRALSEIMRVLRPGGYHIFTAPKHRHLLRSVQRAELVDGRVRHMLPPEYHGNPIDEGGSLVTWDYGADFEEHIQKWSGYQVSNYMIRDRRRGLDGEFLDVFAICKDEVNHLSPAER